MSIHEECGLFGISDPHGDCARTTYYGLYALQHRGQEACGIATINQRVLSFHKDVQSVLHLCAPWAPLPLLTPQRGGKQAPRCPTIPLPLLSSS